jgi:signal transduction histidine kinase
VHISDSGCGIAREALARVFAPRPAEAGRTGHPSGDLGLAAVRSLIERHEGDIIAHSDGPGLGSRFVVRLPALPAPPSYRSSTRRP